MFELAPVYIWLIIGFVCLIIEFKLPTIGFLFLGLGGLTNAVLVSSYPPCLDYQFVCFGLVSLAWFIILWYPLKKYMHKGDKHQTFDIIGSRVEVYGTRILVGGEGVVKWSGAIMNARLDVSAVTPAEVGEKLIVEGVKGNILLCAKH